MSVSTTAPSCGLSRNVQTSNTRFTIYHAKNPTSLFSILRSSGSQTSMVTHIHITSSTLKTLLTYFSNNRSIIHQLSSLRAYLTFPTHVSFINACERGKEKKIIIYLRQHLESDPISGIMPSFSAAARRESPFSLAPFYVYNMHSTYRLSSRCRCTHERTSLYRALKYNSSDDLIALSCCGCSEEQRARASSMTFCALWMGLKRLTRISDRRNVFWNEIIIMASRREF